MSMTENEAKGFIQGKLDCMNKCDVFDCKNTDECDGCNYCYLQGNFGEQKKAFKMAIQALEEIQQYRAIGTVQEVAKLSNSWTNVNYKLRQFEKIGTIEEFNALKEKSVAKKPIRKPNHNWTDEEVICPACGSYILGNNHHCKCGQALET